jgi:hypothetical protein
MQVFFQFLKIITLESEIQGWFWQENKITENQWKIAETI